MEVAVARMENVRDPKPVPHSSLFDEPKDVGQASAGDDPVLDVVVGGEAPHRGERALAARPEPLALQRARRDANLARKVSAADLLDPRTRVVEPIARTVDLEKEDAAGVEGITGVHGGLDGLDRELIHHLD